MKYVVARLESLNLGLDFRVQYLTGGEINQLDMILVVKHDVCAFEVTVDHLLLAQVLESQHDLSCKVLSQDIAEASVVLAFEEVCKAATGTVLHKQVELVPIFERMIKFDDRGVIQT